MTSHTKVTVNNVSVCVVMTTHAKVTVNSVCVIMTSHTKVTVNIVSVCVIMTSHTKVTVNIVSVCVIMTSHTKVTVNSVSVCRALILLTFSDFHHVPFKLRLSVMFCSLLLIACHILLTFADCMSWFAHFYRLPSCFRGWTPGSSLVCSTRTWLDVCSVR